MINISLLSSLHSVLVVFIPTLAPTPPSESIPIVHVTDLVSNLHGNLDAQLLILVHKQSFQPPVLLDAPPAVLLRPLLVLVRETLVRLQLLDTCLQVLLLHLQRLDFGTEAPVFLSHSHRATGLQRQSQEGTTTNQSITTTNQ